MKKILFTLMILLSIGFASCNQYDEVTREVKKNEARKYETLNVSDVRTLRVKGFFYIYDNDYNKAERALLSYKQEKEMLMLFGMDFSGFSKPFSSEEINKMYEIKKNFDKRVKTCEAKIDSLTIVKDSIAQNTQDGVLYVVKAQRVNKFGLKSKDYDYYVYYYDKGKRLTKYDRDYRMYCEIVKAAYKNAML